MDPRELERVSERYGRYARDPRLRRRWAADNPGNVAIRAELLDAVWDMAASELSSGGSATAGSGKPPAPGGVLDAGCGGGYWLEALIEHGVPPTRLHGVDLLAPRLDIARERLPAAVELRQADVRQLPYADASFDAVLLLTVLSSLAGPADVRTALLEARRVTRAGGLVLVYEPRRRWPPGRRTAAVPLALARETLGSVAERPLTVHPPIARRLGRLTDVAYPRLAGRRWATSHRLLAHRVAARDDIVRQ